MMIRCADAKRGVATAVHCTVPRNYEVPSCNARACSDLTDRVAIGEANTPGMGSTKVSSHPICRWNRGPEGLRTDVGTQGQTVVCALASVQAKTALAMSPPSRESPRSRRPPPTPQIVPPVIGLAKAPGTTAVQWRGTTGHEV